MASSGSPNYDPMTFNDPWIQSSSLTMNANTGPSGSAPEEYDIASTYSQVAAAVAASQQAPGTPVQSYPWMQQTNFHENLDFMPTMQEIAGSAPGTSIHGGYSLMPPGPPTVSPGVPT